MHSIALAFKDEYDEVPVSSTETLEANVVAIRDVLNDFKNEVRTAFGNIREEFTSVRTEFASVRAEIASLRKESHEEFSNVYREIKWLRERSDKNHERLSTKIEATNEEVAQLRKAVVLVESKVDALKWIWGGLGGLGGLVVIIELLNRLFHWH